MGDSVGLMVPEKCRKCVPVQRGGRWLTSRPAAGPSSLLMRYQRVAARRAASLAVNEASSKVEIASSGAGGGGQAASGAASRAASTFWVLGAAVSGDPGAGPGSSGGAVVDS